MFSLESPHQGDSNEYTQYTIFNVKKKITLNYPKSAAMGFSSKVLKKEFETAMVNEPSVFEPLKFYCTNMYRYITELILQSHAQTFLSFTVEFVIDVYRRSIFTLFSHISGDY